MLPITAVDTVSKLMDGATATNGGADPAPFASKSFISGDRRLALQEEIDNQRRLIKADGYSVSIGEIASMYKEGDLDIHPAFQRFFRWKIEQKSRWIESLLLGIPAPSIFVAQRTDGVWDVVDGLQRLSTIFEFMGILRDQSGNVKPPLKLTKTRYLPSLEGVSWSEGEKPLTDDQQRFLKREKLDIKIVKRESDSAGKYELFQRLNSGGSSLSDQELRNCMLVSIDPSFFDWIDKLSKTDEFTTTVPLAERLLVERFDLELVLRYLLFRNINLDEFKRFSSISEFITDKMLAVVNDKHFDRDAERASFISVFGQLAQSMGDEAFRKWDATKGKAVGSFLYSAYEIVAMGLGHTLSPRRNFKAPELLRQHIHAKVWASIDEVGSKTGESAVARLPRTLAAGRRIFAK